MKRCGLAVLGAILLTHCFQSCTVSKEIKEDFRTETYKSRVAYFSENPLKDGQIVFFGNSITQAGEWRHYFPDFDVANRGISGDNTEGMLARLSEVTSAKPSKFFIMAGINDISLSRSNKKIIDNYRAIIQQIKKESPETEIFIQSILPINNDFKRYKRLFGKEKQVINLNQKLRILAKKGGVVFIDLFPYFADADGKLRKELTGDGLHLNAEAYWTWSNIIRRFVE